MKSSTPRPATLREIELEVEAEGREWARRRLQEEARRHGEASPAAVSGGVIELQVMHGHDPGNEHWGLTSHQPLSLALCECAPWNLG